jgi:hypothetical protein
LIQEIFLTVTSFAVRFQKGVLNGSGRIASMGKHGPALQRTNTKKLKKYSQEKELPSQSPNFHIHESVSDLYIPTIGLPILLQEICGPIL